MSTVNNLVADFIFAHHQQLAEQLTEKHYQHHPQLLTRYGENGKQRCLQDALIHFDYLAQALLVSYCLGKNSVGAIWRFTGGFEPQS